MDMRQPVFRRPAYESCTAHRRDVVAESGQNLANGKMPVMRPQSFLD